MKKVSATRWLVLAACMFLRTLSGVSQVATPVVSLSLTDGSQLIGELINQTPVQATIRTASLEDTAGHAPVTVTVDISRISSCSMAEPGVSPISIGGNHCTPVTRGLHNGFQKASASVGFTGSAQKDENAKGSVTLAGYQSVDNVESYRGKTNLVLSGSYDDKWKATPSSSNITHTYDGLLTQDILARRSPPNNCGTDDQPRDYRTVAHAYHNNSQGVQVDQSYGFGVSKTFLIFASGGVKQRGCSNPDDQFVQTAGLSADIRSVNYFLYSPGGTDHGVGTQFQLSYSRTFRSKQSVAVMVAGVPVYNRSDMSQAAGDFIYFVPLSASWLINFNVQEDYYEIAPKTFNKNYIAFTVGLTFVPPKPATAKTGGK